MTNREKLEAMFHELKDRGIVKNQKTLADLIGATPPTISGAFNGNPKYCTTSILVRINDSVDNIFCRKWIIDGEGPMLRQLSGDTTVDIDLSMHQTSGDNGTNIIGHDAAVAHRLQVEIEYLKKANEDLRKQLEEVKADKEKLLEAFLKK